MLQHKVQLPVSNKEGKNLLCKQCLYIFVVLFCVTAVVSMPRLANFSPCDPVIFCFSLTLYTHSLLKNEFFSNVHGLLLRKEQRKRKVQAKRVSNRRGKKLFLALFCALTQTFFAVLARHRCEAIKEKASLLVIKK